MGLQVGIKRGTGGIKQCAHIGFVFHAALLSINSLQVSNVLKRTYRNPWSAIFDPLNGRKQIFGETKKIGKFIMQP